MDAENGAAIVHHAASVQITRSPVRACQHRAPLLGRVTMASRIAIAETLRAKRMKTSATVPPGTCSCETAGSRLERPLHVNPDGIEGCRGGDEQAIVVRAAKCQVGDDLIHDDLPQQHAIGRETLDAAAGAGPDVAFNIQSKAV